jgi:hypothetical protein
LDKPLIPVFLIFHDVLATALLIVISWQAVAAWAPRIVPAGPLAVLRLRDTVTALLVLVIALGAILYPSYRFTVRPYLETNELRALNGAFEIKEHFAALILMMLPAYRAVWHSRAPHDPSGARRVLSGLLCAMVWWNFVIGHVMNSIKGLL